MAVLYNIYFMKFTGLLRYEDINDYTAKSTKSIKALIFRILLI